MTVSTSYAPLSFNGDDATTAFAVTWPFFDSSLVVTLVDSTGVETVKTITTHYTVSGGTDSDGLPATGTVTMLTAPASGETLRITRNTSKVQSSSWTNGGAYQAKTLEATLDKIILIAQETQAGINDDITGDVMQLNTSGATDYWDAESQIIRNVANATASTDAVNYATLQAEMVAAGSADVVGPVSATDNAVARFDSTTGKIIQSSGVTIDDSGNVTGAANLPIRVTSIAALKALDTSVYSLAFLSLGRRSGLFEFRSGDYSTEVTADTLNGIYAAADDTASTSGAWVRVTNEHYISPLWFGMAADGVTDDTAALQAAINMAIVVESTYYGETHGWVHIPPGNIMTTPLAITKKIRLTGSGTDVTVLRLIDGETGALLTISAVNVAGTSIDDNYATTIEDISLEGNRPDATTQNNSHGIYCPDAGFALGTQYGASVYLTHVRVHGFTGHGIYLGVNRNWCIAHNVNCRYNNKSGLYSDAYDCLITSCNFGGNEDHGIFLNSGGAFSFVGCNIYYNTENNVYINQYVNAYVAFTQCSLDAAGQNNVRIQNSSNSDIYSFHACRFNGAGTSATNTYADIDIDGDNIVVTGCHFVKLGSTVPAYCIKTNSAAIAHVSGLVYDTGTPPYGTAFCDNYSYLRYSGPQAGNFSSSGNGGSTFSQYIGNSEITRIGSGGLDVYQDIQLNRAAGNARSINFQTSGAARWSFGCDGSAESGSDAGSDLFLNRYNDSAVYQDTPFSVSRATGIASFSQAVQLSGVTTVAGLPTPAVGMIARVSDANAPSIGSTVAGSGAAAALVWYNGSNWTVIGV